MKIIFGVLVVIGVCFFVLDRHLYYFGKSDFGFYALLPLNIKPEYKPDFEGGFALYDAYGFSIAGRGVKFRGSQAEVREVVRYGFNDETVIVLVEDITGKRYFAEFTKSEGSQSEQDLDVHIWGEDKNFSSNDYKWIEIQAGTESIERIELCRNYLMFAVITLVIILMINILKNLTQR